MISRCTEEKEEKNRKTKKKNDENAKKKVMRENTRRLTKKKNCYCPTCKGQVLHYRISIFPLKEGARIKERGVDTHDFVEDGRVVVDVLDGDFEGADVVQLGPAIVRGEYGQVDLLLAGRLVPVEHVSRPYQAGPVVYLELELLPVGDDEAVRDDSYSAGDRQRRHFFSDRREIYIYLLLLR